MIKSEYDAYLAEEKARQLRSAADDIERNTIKEVENGTWTDELGFMRNRARVEILRIRAGVLEKILNAWREGQP